MSSWLPRRFGRIGFVALLLAGGLVVWQRTLPLRKPAVPNIDPVIGRMLPLAGTVPLPGHAEPSMPVAKSGQAHLVNLFASWCVACRVEAPVLATLAADGVRIDGIAVRDEPAAVARFLQHDGNPFAGVRLDRRGQVQAALGAAGLPETYLVDAGGMVRYRHRGALRADDLAAITNELQQARATR
ncbi:MAG: redoxin family protein [Pseudomonadota bacterium]|nr:redoxin family protein [Pseudomonadota bacterium]